MKITNNPVQGGNVAGAKKTDRPAKADSPKEKGSVSAAAAFAPKAEISTRGKEMATAKAVADSAPDVREDRVAELKKRIASGQYQVDADAVADRMMKEHLSSGIG